MSLKEIPKIELHVHLDGSVRLKTASKLLNKEMQLIQKEMVASNTCTSLEEYLKSFDIPLTLLQTKDNLSLVSEELAKDLIDDGVVYAEIRFCPAFHANSGLTMDEVVEAVLSGLSKVPLKTNLILCMMRNFTDCENEKIIALTQKYLDKGVVAIDLAGDEAKYPTSKFEELFQTILEKKIPFTIHAGEAAGTSSIRSAITFGTKRIGHGIKIIEDNRLMKEALEKNILLEVCPTSNVQTKAVPSYETHPIKKLFDAGLSVSVNTDNRTVSNITLTQEYELLHHYFHFSSEDFYKMNCMALEHSFLKEDEKKEIKEKLKYR